MPVNIKHVHLSVRIAVGLGGGMWYLLQNNLDIILYFHHPSRRLRHRHPHRHSHCRHRGHHRHRHPRQSIKLTLTSSMINHPLSVLSYSPEILLFLPIAPLSL